MKQIDIALQEWSTSEIVGSVNNPRITQYFKEIGFPYDEQVAWCSAFANWVCMKANLPRSNALNARSWLSVGTPVTTPQLGDIVVLWRNSPSSWEGHVGFYINSDKDTISLLAGNQSDQVNISKYPKSQLLGYRRLTNTTSDSEVVNLEKARLLKAITALF